MKRRYHSYWKWIGEYTPHGSSCIIEMFTFLIDHSWFSNEYKQVNKEVIIIKDVNIGPLLKWRNFYLFVQIYISRPFHNKKSSLGKQEKKISNQKLSSFRTNKTTKLNSSEANYYWSKSVYNNIAYHEK